MKDINTHNGFPAKNYVFAIWLTIILFLAGGCTPAPVSPPSLISLDPVSGPPGTIVEVSGSDLFLAGLRWDANQLTEQTLPSALLGVSFFTVPLAVSHSPHPVALVKDGQYSNKINFNVTDGTIRPQPRLDDVTVNYFDINNSTGKASMFLMVHGANFDVGAKILVNDVEQPTVFSRLLRNPDINVLNPATLGYPIFHYATVWAQLNDQTRGSTIKVSIKNLDGIVSNDIDYRIAANGAELDSDGDGLPDNWEQNGYDANGDGTIDVDLPNLGANPFRKDIFVECDWMNDAAPNANIWAAIEDSFAKAPILNSDGSQGISIHIDRGQAGAGGGGGTIIPFAEFIGYTATAPHHEMNYVNFHAVKTNNFNANRLNIYRYCVFAWDNARFPSTSGQAEDSWSNDFFVSLGHAGANGQRIDFQTGTFIHELGHTLNLHHGGAEDTNSKDNYNSVMQYGNGWITWSGLNNRYSPSQWSGIDVNCNMLDVDGVFTYSEGMRRDLDENNLDENIGVCGNIARDWNEDTMMQNPVSVNLDADAALSIIQDYADWANIEINFRAPGSSWGND